MIKLHNNLTRELETFTPIDPKNVRVYACGPTVYDRAHIGNARPAVIFDVLVRLLRHVYGDDHVTYVRNITDVDDKINARAKESNRTIGEITSETGAWYVEDMSALGVIRPDHEPRATDYIPEMIAMIGTLIEKGHAYEAEGHVLFKVRSYDAYGALSRRSLDDMIAGARVEVAPYKEDPMDFVLWKPAGDGPGWESPWGAGRPGWHIECSAMSRKILGETFDIHAGGADLQFPHHENEIAQSCACHGTERMANYWIHNAMLNVNGVKMSKSLGNFFTVRDLLNRGISGEVMRFVLLSTHYSKTLDWSDDRVQEAEKTLRKWRALTNDVKAVAPSEAFLNELYNDINTAGAIAVMHGLAKEGEAALLKSCAALLGLLGDELGGWEVVRNVPNAATDRDHFLMKIMGDARSDKNFELSDRIRKAYTDGGFQINQLDGINHVGLNEAVTAEIDTTLIDALYAELKYANGNG